MSNPLEADPECMQLAQLIIKQSSNEGQGRQIFGFTKKQVRNLTCSQTGQAIWNSLNECFVPKGKLRKKVFDFSLFCRKFCEPELNLVRQCFKNARSDHPSHDPREICFPEVFNLCKKIECTWTDLTSRTTSSV